MDVRMIVLLRDPARLIRVAQWLIVGGSSVCLSRVHPYNSTQSCGCKYPKRIKTTKITQLLIFVTIAHITICFGGLVLSNINNYDNAIIAEKIKKECARQNITLKTMLQELNISINAVQQMRKNDKTPNYKSIARICDYLNISIDALLDRPAPTPTPAPPDLGAAIAIVASAAGLSADYVRGVLHLPPSGSCTNDNM